MERSLCEIIGDYDPGRPLEKAWTIPAEWYTDPRIARLESSTVFSRSWQVIARADQLAAPGRFVTARPAGEPVLAVRGEDGRLRAFFNVCRHHASEIAIGECGTTDRLRCPYHGWTYALDGRLEGAPEFKGVRGFDPAASGLVPVAIDTWEGLVFVRLDPEGPSLAEDIGDDLSGRVKHLGLERFRFVERRRYELACNWKVFVDNYLDGGYHVPHLHRGLNSVLDYRGYTIENGHRYCLQSSPMTERGADARTGAVRSGDRALYFWIYPNLMINWYEGVLDTNLVLPAGVDRTEVIFDFWFTDVSPAASGRNRASIEVGHGIQEEDLAICESVQRGVASRAWRAGRLSARREAGEHLFHRLLHADLTRGLASTGRI